MFKAIKNLNGSLQSVPQRRKSSSVGTHDNDIPPPSPRPVTKTRLGRLRTRTHTTKLTRNKTTGTDITEIYDLFYISKEVVGSGHFSTVFKGVRRSDRLNVAVKVIAKSGSKAAPLRFIESEISALEALSRENDRGIGHASTKARNHNVLRLLHSSEDAKHVYLVTELCPGGDLLVKTAQLERLPEKACAAVMSILCEALKYCHEKGIIHRDLKPENVLIMKDTNDVNDFSWVKYIKIADFGCAWVRELADKKRGAEIKSKLYADIHDGIQTKSTYRESIKSQTFSVTFDGIDQKKRWLKTFVGSFGYMSPEMILHSPYDEVCDYWGLGMIYFICVSGYHPFIDENATEPVVAEKITKGQFIWHEDVWTSVSEDTQTVIKSLLAKRPKERMTPQETISYLYQKKLIPTAEEETDAQ